MFLYIVIIISTVIALVASVLYYSLEQKIVYKSLKNRHVVVTGGSSGIGKSAALEAAKLGASVTIIGRDVQKLKSAVSEITSHCLNTQQKVQYAALDVTSDYENIEKCLSGLEETIGPIFMLVNCAGMCICGKFEDMKPEDIKQMVNLNYLGTAFSTKYVLPGMKKRNEGLIVFVASEAAFIGIYGYGAYSAAKWALRGLAETILMELVGTDVRLTLSFPPDTDTPGFQNEELTKPKETKLISSSGGLHSPDDIGKKLIHDSMAGKIYSTYGISGKLLALLYGGSLESISQILIQIFSMGFLRAIMVSIVLSFHSIVKDVAKERKQETKKSM
ncbi:3-ketodihydrosphingosine reductase [Amyelois transitella]|uniref:3-ketodihydrosphingosine reductase n=1 Tax=Amyelois transitella TaxID=680683 RepID=UPI00067C85A5|nr:3-ketodihydrosphingosine reductase [Amyelois transitella]XP_060801504.1 3-ketodihydrosphingosine reductase [Amyelois transitella]